MNNSTKKILLCLLFLSTVFLSESYAGTGFANATGNWSDPLTWLINGIPRIPAGGDTLTIPNGITVTVDGNPVTVTGPPLYLYVHGILQFGNGRKLSLPCNSYVYIYADGYMDPAGGGNSNYIQICGATVWQAADGPVDGPQGFGNPPLPIELVNFNAKYSAGKVLLDWSTATEINNDYFLIQRSSDNVAYVNINNTDGSGNSSQTHFYSAVDSKPLNGINYYRLCQVDYDGTRTYSYPRAIRTNGKADVLLFPNPSSADNVSILFTGSMNQNYTLEVKDITGKTILNRENQVLESGINKLGLSGLSELSQGTYFVSILLGDEVYYQKMIIY
jgi:hypothetical protein